MPSYFTQIFSNVMAPPAVKRNLDFSYRHMPMLNEVSTSLSSYLASQGQIAKKKALWRWCKGTAELNAMINKVTNDACSFYHFEPVGRGSGKNRVLKANRFCLENGFRQLRAATMADSLVTGDGFTWLGKINLDKVKDAIKEAFDRYSILETKGKVPALNYEMKSRMINEIFTEMKAGIEQETDDIQDPSKFPDEDVLAPRKIKQIPSSTVEVVYDRYDVKGYNHFLGVYLPMFFSPEEVIHHTLMRRDGKVNGYTSVESVIVQLELLRQMWQNQLALHKNGGSPDKIYNLKNLQVSSPAYKRIEEQIAKYKLAENKHGNMLFTGDLQVFDLQQLDEMQFKDMGLYITGLVAMQWGIPRSSIPFIVGGTNTKDDTGGNSERGYWQFIRGIQLTDAEFWNTQLFIPYFKVKLVPELSYPQLDVQEESARMSKIQNLQNIDMLLQKSKKMISYDKKLEILGLTEEDIEEAPEDLLGGDTNGLNTGTPKTSSDRPNTEQHAGRANAKKQEQQNTIASRGKPTGYGKEIEEIRDSITELKGFIAGTLQKAAIYTQYENQPKIRKDEPVKQFVDNNSIHDPLHDTAGAELPADWAIDKDNKIRPDGVQKNYRDANMFSQPQIQPQLNTYPTGSITTENLFNPAGNIGYPNDRRYGGDNDYTEGHDTPQTRPKAMAAIHGRQYPSQRKYPDEPTQFPGKDEKENVAQIGYEEEHSEHPEFPPEMIQQIVADHLRKDPYYYSKSKKIIRMAKTMDESCLIELKSMQGSEDQVVDMGTFMKLYQEDRQYQAGKPPRVFMRASYGIVTLKFKSSDFVYKTQISEADLKSVKSSILMTNLSGNIYRL